jgi:hypothetical protein
MSQMSMEPGERSMEPGERSMEPDEHTIMGMMSDKVLPRPCGCRKTVGQ